MQTPGLIAIFGSGELSDSMAEAHRTLMARLQGPVVPVFVDTPAGFELNIDQIDQKATEYFKRNFGLDLGIARYRNVKESADGIAAAVTAIRRANYIFAGPGSPSYAVRTWKDRPASSANCGRRQTRSRRASLPFCSAVRPFLSLRCSRGLPCRSQSKAPSASG